jgi:hypothetical protein
VVVAKKAKGAVSTCGPKARGAGAAQVRGFECEPGGSGSSWVRPEEGDASAGATWQRDAEEGGDVGWLLGCAAACARAGPEGRAAARWAAVYDGPNAKKKKQK